MRADEEEGVRGKVYYECEVLASAKREEGGQFMGARHEKTRNKTETVVMNGEGEDREA